MNSFAKKLADVWVIVVPATMFAMAGVCLLVASALKDIRAVQLLHPDFVLPIFAFAFALLGALFAGFVIRNAIAPKHDK